MNDNLEPPKTIAEVGIVIHFMSKDIDKLTKAVEAMGSNYVPNTIHIALESKVDKQEGRLKTLEQFKESLGGRIWGVVAAIGVICGAVEFFITTLINYYHK